MIRPQKMFYFYMITFLMSQYGQYGCNKQSFKTIAYQTNTITAKSLISVYKNVYEYLESPEGADTVCGHLIEEHKDDIKNGSYSKEQLEKDCTIEMRLIEMKFDKKLTQAALALETFEKALEVWDQFDKKEIFKMIKSAVDGINSLIDFLEEIDVDVPDELIYFVTYVNNLANGL